MIVIFLVVVDIECILLSICFVFFKQKTAYEMRISDWSSDVCSSDLVYDQAPDAETLLMSDNAPVASSDDDVEDEAEAALTTVDSDFGRTTDPVRMYMREMGTVELLTREGEIEIAKRIEDGLKHMVKIGRAHV